MEEFTVGNFLQIITLFIAILLVPFIKFAYSSITDKLEIIFNKLDNSVTKEECTGLRIARDTIGEERQKSHDKEHERQEKDMNGLRLRLNKATNGRT